jgi:uncharacterized membrane protein
MTSKATIGEHPLQPVVVPIPIGCLFASLLADVVYTATYVPAWYMVALYHA